MQNFLIKAQKSIGEIEWHQKKMYAKNCVKMLMKLTRDLIFSLFLGISEIHSWNNSDDDHFVWNYCELDFINTVFFSSFHQTLYNTAEKMEFKLQISIRLSYNQIRLQQLGLGTANFGSFLPLLVIIVRIHVLNWPFGWNKIFQLYSFVITVIVITEFVRKYVFCYWAIRIGRNLQMDRQIQHFMSYSHPRAIMTLAAFYGMKWDMCVVCACEWERERGSVCACKKWHKVISIWVYASCVWKDFSFISRLYEKKVASFHEMSGAR